SSCFDLLARDIVIAGGTVDKFMGDAVMAIFGAPIAHEDDAARALRAALRMQASMERFNAEQHLALALRVGVNTGPVVVGTRHVGGLNEYTATGDTVNVAARLQQTGEPGQIVAGEATVRQIGKSFTLRPLSSTQIRGKQDPVAAFLVDGHADGVDGRGQSEVAFINRRAELARLTRVLNQVVKGKGRIVLITGEPGIGKSRLLSEARSLTPNSVSWFEGRGRTDGATLNYHVFRALTQQLFDLDESAETGADADNLRNILVGLGTGQAYPYLGGTADLPDPSGEHEPLEHLRGDQVEQRAIRDLSKLVEAVTRRKPGVLALDDLHWADPASLALVNGFLPLVTRVPLVLLLSFRDEPGSPIGAIRDRARRELPRWTTELALRPLTPRQTANLVDELLRDHPGTTALRAAVQAKSEGNPLFVEEIVRSVLASGRLDLNASDATVRLPVSIQGMILSRVDLLPDTTRRALQVAAVFGRDFTLDVLERVDAEISADLLNPALDAAIIMEVGTEGTGHYAFRHALSREAIYRTLLLRRRRELHARVAHAIEEGLTETSQEAALLAYHFAQAQRWPEVVKYAGMAGDQAARAYASRDAASHYTQAMEALERLGDRAPAGRAAELLWARARAFEHMGDWQRALSDFHAALEIVSDEQLRQALLLSLARVHADHDEYADALRWTEQILQLARAMSDRRLHARALSLEARVLVRQSRAQDAVERLTEALEVHREIGDRRGEAETLDNLAAPLSLLGDVIGAYDHQLAAVEIFRELGNREREGDALSVLAEWQWFMGEFARALETARAARSLHEELGVRRYQAHDWLVEGTALASLGQLREAIALLNQAAQLAEQLEHPEWVAHALVPLGIAYRATRRLRRAQQAFDRAAEVGDRIGARLWAQLGRVGLAFTSMLQGHPADAELSFRTILSAPEGLQYPRARAMTGLGMLELERGNPQLADDWARWSVAICEAAPYIEALLEAQILRGRALAALGDAISAETLLTQVHDQARERGARPLQTQARQALAELRMQH
ncbi:MAG TPA: AAA family ATPase, partial [Chloroflexota bacterium]|nr:AAA family ATPase [Chloroflexota bacterium]